MYQHGIVQQDEEEGQIVHVGFVTDEEAVNWAAAHLVDGEWSYATVSVVG